MTTDEKLKHFTTVILESTKSQCDQTLAEYKSSMDRYFESHKEEALKSRQLEESIEADRIRRKISREYTTEQLHIRRKINHKQEELKAKLLAEVEAMLEAFFMTEDYTRLLIRQIEEAKKVARGEQINIFLDIKDERLKEELERATGETLITDGRIFYGGIKAEIPKKNILIDNSFESKLDNWMETYLVEPEK